MAAVTPDLIFQVANGFMASKLLFVANDVGLFEALADAPVTLDDLVPRMGIPRRTLRIVADALVALGLLERQGDQYRNTPVTATFLSGRTPSDLRPALRFLDQFTYRRWSQLADAVRTGRAVFGQFALTPEELALYTPGVEAITAGAAHALPRTYGFAGHQKLLDLGGGSGSFLLAVLRQYPNLQGTLFDLPAVAARARAPLAASPIASRVQVVAGDFFTDALPAGHDVILIANVLHDFLPERTVTILRRIHDTAPAFTRLLLVDFWTNPEHTQPLMAALNAGTFLMMSGEGDVYSAEEARGWLESSGWRALEHIPLAGPSSLIVAEKAR